MNHEHRFQRLRDDALFCECGEIRYVPAVPAVYPVPTPYPVPWTPWPDATPSWPNTVTYPVVPLTITYSPNTITTDFPNRDRMVVYGTTQGAKA